MNNFTDPASNWLYAEGSGGSEYYHEGKRYTKEQLKEMGGKLFRQDTARIKSQAFKDFIRSQGRSFKRKAWKYVMETWELPDGTRIENHYFHHKSGATYYHD